MPTKKNWDWKDFDWNNDEYWPSETLPRWSAEGSEKAGQDEKRRGEKHETG